MALILASSKDELLALLGERLKTLVEPDDAENLTRFSQQFFGIAPLEELRGRHDSDLLGCTLSSWRFFQQFDGNDQKIRVFNPDTQQHGWQTTHSVVEILHRDAPFLVDSVRMELKRQGYLVHTMQNSVMHVERDGQGKLLRIHGRNEAGEQGHAESLMFIEIDRCANAQELRAVQEGIAGALSHVRAAVADFGPMQQRMNGLAEMLDNEGQSYFSAEERAEAVEFLRWLLADHFTFLGYERFRIHEGLAHGRLGVEGEHSLGVTALDPLDDVTSDLPEEVLDYLRAPVLLSFAKASRLSRVHRPAYPDYVSVREVDELASDDRSADESDTDDRLGRAADDAGVVPVRRAYIAKACRAFPICGARSNR